MVLVAERSIRGGRKIHGCVDVVRSSFRIVLCDFVSDLEALTWADFTDLFTRLRLRMLQLHLYNFSYASHIFARTASAATIITTKLWRRPTRYHHHLLCLRWVFDCWRDRHNHSCLLLDRILVNIVHHLRLRHRLLCFIKALICSAVPIVLWVIHTSALHLVSCKFSRVTSCSYAEMLRSSRRF